MVDPPIGIHNITWNPQISNDASMGAVSFRRRIFAIMIRHTVLKGMETLPIVVIKGIRTSRRAKSRIMAVIRFFLFFS